MSFERRKTTRWGRELAAFARGRTGRALIVAAVMFVVGYTAAARWLFPAAEDPTDADFTTVPDLSGASFVDAGRRLADLGLVAADRGRLHHPDVPAGSVIAQSPLPGQVARAGDTVALTSSAGSESRVVPELGGLTGDEAATLLRRLGFGVDFVRAPEGMSGVVGTRPGPGTRLTLPAEVELLVGEGVPIAAVPDLRGRHVDDLQAILEEAQLRLGAISYEADAPEGPGRVVSQIPAPHSSLRGGGLVSVVVAGEPPDSVGADLTAPVAPAGRDSTRPAARREPR